MKRQKLLKKQGISQPQFSLGFTLVETLVAISILVTVIAVGTLSIQQNLKNKQYAASEVTANYLAQEAIDYVRAIRDSNKLAKLDGQNVFWLDRIEGAGGCEFVDTGSPSCRIDTTKGYNEGISSICGNNACLVGSDERKKLWYQADGRLGHDTTGEESPYERSVVFDEVRADEVKMNVIVEWTPRASTTPRKIEISENLFNW